MSSYRFRTIKDHEEFLSLKDTWNNLVKVSTFNSIFAVHEWMDAWLRNHFDETDRLAIVIAEGGDGPCAIAPMVVRHGKPYGVPVKLLCFIGTPQADRCDVIIKKGYEAVVPGLMRYMVRHVNGWQQMHLNEIPEHSSFAKYLMKKYPMTYIEPGSECPYIQLSDFSSFKEFYSGLKRKIRLEINRKNNKMTKEGNWKVTHTLGPSLFDSSMYQARKLERKSAKAMRINDLTHLALALPEYWNFQRSLVEKQGSYKILMSTLKRDNQLIAHLYGFIQNRRYHAYNTAFDSEFNWYSPGKIIINDTIRYSMELGCQEFDFLRGASFLKKLWTRKTIDQVHIYHLKKSPMSLLYILAVFKIRPFLRDKIIPIVQQKIASRKKKK